jgi:uncharacterized protein YdeI (YjbR/CyaY-like superfamily)
MFIFEGSKEALKIMLTKDATVEQYFAEGCGRCKLVGTPECKAIIWHKVMEPIREIILDCMLVEEIKWGVPCYTFQGKNVLILSALKEFACIGFFKGVLLSDELNLLHQQEENSQSSRILKFTEIEEVEKLQYVIKAYILEAIEIEKSGEKVVFKTVDEYPLPEELLQKMENNLEFKNAFFALTPGRQRGYIMHFSASKQSKTRIARIEKYESLILKGIGMNEAYKKQ